MRRRRVGEVNSFGNRVVGVFLKSCLHANVPLCGDVMRGHKEFSNVFRNVFYILNCGFSRNGVHEVLAVEPFFQGGGFKYWIHLDEASAEAFSNFADVADGEEGFDAL